MKQQYRKVYVEVVLKVSAGGDVQPMAITFIDGRTYGNRPPPAKAPGTFPEGRRHR